MRVGIITGTGTYELHFLESVGQKRVVTPFGEVTVNIGFHAGKEVVHLPRHGPNHEYLPHQINHRANIWAMREMGVKFVFATTVCGVVDPKVPLAKPILFDDLYFPDNRLGDGSPCTFFLRPADPERGHYIFSRPFSESLRERVKGAMESIGLEFEPEGVYGHVFSPRFSSRAEVRQWAMLGVKAISQTAGPEAVLCGELEIPYALLGFGVDYCNGVVPEPTPVEELEANLKRSKEVFSEVIRALLEREDLKDVTFDSGFVFRFEGRAEK
ncbi:MAG TPA: phosphorylase [Armatimonadetes bacterium]|nr:phosphorylase [Armatimonadota bacterium]